MIACDDGMIRQVITNLLQNAVDAMIEADTSDKKIRIMLTKTPDKIQVMIIDNGPGLPLSKRKHLTDPYVTNRKKVAGWGLLLLRKSWKTMGDHCTYPVCRTMMLI